MITAQLIKKIAPRANSAIATDVALYFSRHSVRYEVNTPLRIAHFLAQAAHETDGFVTLEEYASGRAYEGRADLGNTHVGDGVRYKGRGIFQLTGRNNYEIIGNKLGIPLLNNPTLAATPEVSVLTALEFWVSRNLSEKADYDDIEGITRRINGGTNGLVKRREYLNLAKIALNINVVASFGTKGDIVKDIQRALGIEVDGDFGPKTRTAIKLYQASNGLPQTGYVDTDLFTRLVHHN